jgi:hypothetical protein
VHKIVGIGLALAGLGASFLPGRADACGAAAGAASIPSAPVMPRSHKQAPAQAVIVPIPAPVASTVPDDDIVKEARKRYDAGKAAYAKHDYKSALREFRTAEGALGFRASPTLSYYLALTSESLRHLRAAASYYQKYLDAAPWAANTEAVQKKIANLERDIANKAGAAEQDSDLAPESVAFDNTNNGDPFGGGMLPHSNNDVLQAQIVAENGTDSSAGATTETGKADTGTKVRADRDDGGDYHPWKRPKYWWVSLVAVGGAAAIVGLTFGAMAASSSSGTGTASSAITVRF